MRASGGPVAGQWRGPGPGPRTCLRPTSPPRYQRQRREHRGPRGPARPGPHARRHGLGGVLAATGGHGTRRDGTNRCPAAAADSRTAARPGARPCSAAARLGEGTDTRGGVVRYGAVRCVAKPAAAWRIPASAARSGVAVPPSASARLGETGSAAAGRGGARRAAAGEGAPPPPGRGGVGRGRSAVAAAARANRRGHVLRSVNVVHPGHQAPRDRVGGLCDKVGCFHELM